MQDLLPHFERELTFLRGQAAEFARRHPKIAAGLLLGNDVGEDPHVQRLIESFALLSSRIHKRLDDDFPLFTESFLEVLYPHYLRPFPSCSIAVLSPSLEKGEGAKVAIVARGSYFESQLVQGIKCRFRTAYDVALAPLQVAAAGFRSAVGAPDGSPVPRAATSCFSITLALSVKEANWATLGLAVLRVGLDGDASQISALRGALCNRVVGVMLQATPHGRWQALADALPREVGFADDEALIDADARSHPAYRLLTEYFAFPEKFNFIDLPLPKSLSESTERSITLHYAMAGLRSESDQARLLETLTEKNLLLGATPVVNLFEQAAQPIRVTAVTDRYPVLASSLHAAAHEIYSIESVECVRREASGETIFPYQPFYSLQHDELLSAGESGGRYWYAHNDQSSAEKSPGYETELSIVDIHFNPAAAHADSLSIIVKATNRDLPNRLAIGQASGDLTPMAGVAASSARLTRKPSLSMRFERGHGALWRLISHLSLNHLSLSGGGIENLRELFRLYDLPRSATNARQVAGLVSIDYRGASACLAGNPFATFVRGTEIRLFVDESNFAGSGLGLFAQVLDRFFGLYVHANSFTQLKIHCARTQQELISCPRRSGDSPLL